MIKKRFGQLFFPHDHKPEHVKSLDGLRGLAITLVMLSHASNAGLNFIGLDFHGAGRTGVYLFFILSAYLLDSQIAYKLQHKQATRHYWKNYFLRRFTRIYPLFAIALSVYFIVDYAGYTTPINQLSDIPMHLMLQRGKSIFWSIPVEVIYYLISPVIIYICFRWFGWQLKWVVLFFTGLMVLVYAGNEQGAFSEFSTFRYLIIFLFGALMAIIELTKNSWFSNRRTPLEILGWIALAFIILATPSFSEPFTKEPLFTFDPRYQPLFGLAGMLLLVAGKYGTGRLQWLFELKVFRFLGAISFSLYLFHILVLRTITLFFRIDGIAGWLLFFAMSIGFSVVTYAFIEKPLMKFRIKPQVQSRHE